MFFWVPRWLGQDARLCSQPPPPSLPTVSGPCCLSLQEAIAALKGKITAYSREGEWQNQCIRNDKELVHVQLRKLKAQRTQARGKSQENLVKLTLESNAALKGLKKVVEKVKRTNQETWLEAKGIRETWGGAPSSSLVKWRMSVFAFLLMLFSF